MGTESTLENYCLVCLANGRNVVGDAEDFARRCKDHRPHEGPYIIYADISMLREYEQWLEKQKREACIAFGLPKELL